MSRAPQEIFMVKIQVDGRFISDIPETNRGQ